MFNGKLRPVLSAGLVLCFSMLLTSMLSLEANAARKSAAMVIDAHNGRILYSHNIDKLHHPASLTKIMTIYMLFEFIKAGRLDLDSPLKVTAHAASQQPSKLGLKEGTTIRVEDAIKALIVKSANDVAVTIAENIAGSEWKFAQLMTWKARQLGMSKTVFRNASGLPDMKQVTTAREMIILCERIQADFPELYPFFATKTLAYNGRVYKTYNRLMIRTRGMDGIKTGYTRASGFNLTSSLWSGRKHVIGVVMGGQSSRKRDAFMDRILKSSVRKASNGSPKKYYAVVRRQKSKTPPPPVMAEKKQLQMPPVVTEKPVVVAALNKKSPEGLKKLGAAVPVLETGKGPFHIQIGAFSTREDALARLETVGSIAGSFLKGHDRFTMQVPEQTIFRARFAGFSEEDARKTCAQLKKKSVDCLAVPAP